MFLHSSKINSINSMCWICNTCLKKLDTVRDLGVPFESWLWIVEHISYLCTDTWKTLNLKKLGFLFYNSAISFSNNREVPGERFIWKSVYGCVNFINSLSSTDSLACLLHFYYFSFYLELIYYRS